MQAGNGQEPYHALVKRVGRAIAMRRKQRHLTQIQLAERMSVEKETVSRMETGAIVPTLMRLSQLARILDCTLSELLSEVAPGVEAKVQKISALLSDLDEDEQLVVLEFVEQATSLFRRHKSSSREGDGKDLTSKGGQCD